MEFEKSMELMHVVDNGINTARVFFTATLPYYGAPKKCGAYVVYVTANYDNDFLYHVSCHETFTDALHAIKKCGFSEKETGFGI